MGTRSRNNGSHEKLQEQIAKLNAIGIALSSEHDLNQLLSLIVQEVRGFTNADGGSLYIREDNKLNFLVAQTESLQRRQDGGPAFKPFYLPLTKESISGYVAVTGEVLNIEDVYQIPPTAPFRWYKDFDKQHGYRTKSMLVVPMKNHKDEIIGVLQLINSLNARGEVIPFEKQFERLVLSLASQAAVAIQNAKLLDEVKNLFRSLVRYSAKAIDSRSPHTAGHSGRVAKYSMRMAQAINEEADGRLGRVHFSPAQLEELRMAAWLHDIGKIGVRESVLEKSTKLNDDQIEAISARCEAIKKSLLAEAALEKLRLSQNGKNASASPDDVDEKALADIQILDDELEFIKQINIPGWMSDEQLEKLRFIAERTYVDSKGERRYFLSALEFESLSVRKGNLTESEYKEIQSHVNHTLDILNKIPFTKDLENIPKYAAAHHEFLDGSGYPQGLKGDQIPIQSRIMCIADIYDALSSPDRPYKKAIPLEKTLDILREESKRGKIDADIVEMFIRRKLFQRPQVEDEE